METATHFLHILALILYGLSLAAAVAAILVRQVPGWAAPALAGLGVTAQLVQLVGRWVASGHLPVTGLFETQHFLALWVAAITVYFAIRYRAGYFIPSAMLFTVAALLFGGKGPMTISPLTPAIDTPMFLIHVATSFAAYGLFGVAAMVGLHRLLRIPASSEGHERRMIDESIYLGYILFTWCMIAGSLWAYLAWGSYWTWRIKGLWSWILWFYYSGVLHVRNRAGWQGWPFDILAIAGFILVLFTYLGLGLLFTTSHPLLPE
jgi:ABC-type transport system involved in cytochrome c biogenesis permease subunit